MPIEDLTTKGELRRFVEATVPDFRPLINQLQGAVAGGVRPACSAYLNGSQTITTGGSGTVVGLDSETVDEGTDIPQHDNVTNNSRLTCQLPGLYWVAGGGEWATGDSGGSFREIVLLQNGSLHTHTGTGVETPDAFGVDHRVYRLLRLNAGDFCELRARHDAGANRSVTGVMLMWFWVSP